MKTMNRTYIRWTAFFLTLILSLSAIAVVPAAAEENTPTQGTLVISEICAAPSVGAKYEFIEVTNASDYPVDLKNYSLLRYGFSDDSGKYDASGLQQLMGWNNYLADLNIINLSEKITDSSIDTVLSRNEVAVLWFVNETDASSYSVDDFKRKWEITNQNVNVIKIVFANAINESTINAKNTNKTFLPEIHASFAISLVKTASLPATVIDTNSTACSLNALKTAPLSVHIYHDETVNLQNLADCIALYFNRGTANTESHNYYNFVNVGLFKAATNTAMTENGVTATVQTPYKNILVGDMDEHGNYPVRPYWNYANGNWTTVSGIGYAFVSDGTPKGKVTPGTLLAGQFSNLAVPAAQNKVSGNTQDVRFIGWVDSTDYREVGIKVTAEYVSGAEKVSKNGVQTLTTETVYSTVTGNGKTYTTSSPEINKGDKGHLMAIAITGIDTDVDTHIIFYVTAFGVLADGTTVYGKTASAVLNGTKLTNPAKFDFRIMTFNVLRANQRTTLNYDAALKSVLDYDADVVGFQEYCAAFTANLTKKLNENGYTVIGNPYDTQRNDYSGNTLYADQNMTPLAYKTNKFICLDSGAGCVSGTYNGVTNTYPGHWITWAVLQSKVTGEVFAVANTHGFHKSNTAAMIEGQCTYHVPAMIQTIYNLMNNVKAKEAKGSDFVCPVLFVGDYNMVPTSEPYLKLFRDYNTQYAATYGVLADARFVALQGYASGRAYHTLGIADRTYGDDTMFDHIVVTESVGVIDHKICVTETTTKASDHYPVYVDIVLSQP